MVLLHTIFKLLRLVSRIVWQDQAEMIHSSSSQSRHGEDTPLLPLQGHHSDNLCSRFRCLRRLPSKAIFLILALTMIILSELYTLIQVTIASFIGSYVPMEVNHLLNALSSPLGSVSAILAAIAIFIH